MGKVWIDGREYEVDSSQNLLHVCLSLGFDLPYFCWHPAMGSVGACRQCAVKQFRDEDDRDGKIVMACMTGASDGTRLSIEDPEARELRASVTELLMANHPHDCPVCDEGGECHLQDVTVMTGHTYRGYGYPKRTHRSQDLGPLLHHEMNRCIECYRCVRFYAGYAGENDLQVFASHDHVYFGRYEDGPLESVFSGNLVEVCPTGVFTDGTLRRHYTRKWDLQTAPSVCVHCGLGCNTIPGEREGTLRRVRCRYNGAVNGYFLCDRGRYGYEFVNHERRLRSPLLPHGPDAPAEAVTAEAALARLAPLLREGARAIGIGSPRASLEGNFALRTLVGRDRFYRGVGEPESSLSACALRILERGPARTPSLREVERADAVLVLGEDTTHTAPMLALAVRQSVREELMKRADQLGIPRWHDAAVREEIEGRCGPLFLLTADATRLDPVACHVRRLLPEEIARVAHAAAARIDPRAPGAADPAPEETELAEEIARVLAEAERPLVISGTSCGSGAVLEGAANLAWALARSRERTSDLFLTLPECNSLGLELLGGAGLEDAFTEAEAGRVDVAVILENDLYRRAERGAVDRFLERVPCVVVLDHVAHETAARAQVVLPAATFAECDGTLVNSEGRAQRFFAVMSPEGDLRAGWRWLRDLARAADRTGTETWEDFDDLGAEIARAVPALAGEPPVAPPASFRVHGARIPRQPFRYSGRTSLHAATSVHEPAPPPDPDSPLAFSMEGHTGGIGGPPPALVPRFWAPGWNSVQSVNKFQAEVGGPLRGGDPGRRLVEPPATDDGFYFERPPQRPERRPGAWRIVALHHALGSEELSALAPGIAELAPTPYLAVGREDATRLSLSEGDRVEAEFDGVRHVLPVRIHPHLAGGALGVPAGLPGLEHASRASWGRIAKVHGP